MEEKSQNNLIPLSERTKEEQRKIAQQGGIASGKVRKEKALLRNSLQLLLNNNIKIPNNPTDKDIKDLSTKLKALGVDTKKMQVNDLVNCGLILGAVYGKAENYKTILETTGELIEESPTYTPKIEEVETIIDNSKLEKALYEENKS